MTYKQLVEECERRAGVHELPPPRSLGEAKAAVQLVAKVARVATFVRMWADAQLSHGAPDMTVEDFIAITGKRRTTFRRRMEYRELFPDVELDQLAWSLAQDDGRPTAAGPAKRETPADGRRPAAA